MGFCTKCGSPRSGASRFCTKCGAEFFDQAGAGQVAQQRPAPPPAEEPTHPDQLATEHPAAQNPLSLPSPGPADLTPASPTESLVLPRSVPPVQVPPGPEPPYWPTRTSGGGNRRVLLVVAVVVAGLAAGGGAFAVVSATASGHPAPALAARPAGRATSRAAPTTTPATPFASAAPSATAAATPTPSPTVSPSPAESSGTVQVAAGAAANPAAPQVIALLNQYFDAINTRNYAEYNSLLDAQLQAGNTPASFAAGYATTTDSAETLTSISGSFGGNLAVTVSFTSQQSPADSVDNSPCNDWLLTLYLVPQGNGYVITPAPAGYQPSYSDC